MKEEKTKSKKKFIYYVVLAVSVLLLIAATVLTVYFVTNGGNPIAEKPPVQEPGEPNQPNDPGKPEEPNEPNEPSTGGDAVRFVSPIEGGRYTVDYNVIYTNATLGWIYRHKAVDFEASAGDEVLCMADGTVESISYSEETGNYIVVNHGDDLKTIYRFVEPTSTLKEGAKVTKGQRIGEVASAYGIEHKDGTHLHLEIMVGGDYVDPTAYLEPVLEEK